jgi:hypothetical protein
MISSSSVDTPFAGENRLGGRPASGRRRRRGAGFYVPQPRAGAAIAACAAATRAIGSRYGEQET